MDPLVFHMTSILVLCFFRTITISQRMRSPSLEVHHQQATTFCTSMSSLACGPCARIRQASLPLSLALFLFHVGFTNNIANTKSTSRINGSQPNPTTGVGSYHNISFTPGKRHRLRIINTSMLLPTADVQGIRLRFTQASRTISKCLSTTIP